MSRASPHDVLAKPLRYLKGVGPRRAADLERAGLASIDDLLYRFPIRYEDRGRFQTIARLQPGQPASIEVEVVTCGLRTTRRPGFRIFEALVRDGSGSVRAIWLNQPFLRDVLAKGQRLVLYGALDVRGGSVQLTNPQYEVGHARRLDRISSCLKSHQGLILAGASFNGVGLPDGVKSGRRAAELVLAGSRRSHDAVRPGLA